MQFNASKNATIEKPETGVRKDGVIRPPANAQARRLSRSDCGWRLSLSSDAGWPRVPVRVAVW
ncbi:MULTISPECIES: hypothetical protein [Burkholderia]|uniref:hypothetical protein n=1 Tax=Burkholderia TaxID=32008 RepID=UPI0013642F7F|nr:MULTISPECIES: hypothetical protein [Burkholderia]